MSSSEKYEDLPTSFWKKWLDADTETRISILGATMLVREYSEHLNTKFNSITLDKKFTKELAARHFNDYLEDLENTLQLQEKEKT